jgi:hypothetical protein
MLRGNVTTTVTKVFVCQFSAVSNLMPHDVRSALSYHNAHRSAYKLTY